MKSLLRCAALCSIVLATAAGCHSSSAPVKTASTLQPATPQPVAPQPATPAAQPAPVAAPQAPPKKLMCKGKTNDGVPGADFAETSSLYTLMNSKLGGWSSCKNKILEYGGGESLVTFVSGATLTFTAYPSSDSAAQEAVLPAGTSITREDVIKALSDELPDGCGVVWSKLSAGGPGATGDYKASGTTCTVDLHVKMLKGSVVGFGFSMAA